MRCNDFSCKYLQFSKFSVNCFYSNQKVMLQHAAYFSVLFNKLKLKTPRYRYFFRGVLNYSEAVARSFSIYFPRIRGTVIGKTGKTTVLPTFDGYRSKTFSFKRPSIILGHIYQKFIAVPLWMNISRYLYMDINARIYEHIADKVRNLCVQVICLSFCKSWNLEVILVFWK